MDILKVKVGNEWVGIPAIKGDTGATGAQGPQGATGATGAKGDTGNSGVYCGETAPTDPNVNVWINPTDDETAVTDVQLNGTSVVTNGVANVPIASSSNLGVVKSESGYGIFINNQTGRLYTDKATTNQAKAGTDQFRPIVPYNQHESAFYGLAKASGNTDQSSSSNAVGTYTEDAKVKIQKMLGIYVPPFELLNEITLEERTSIDLSVDSNGTPYNLLNVFIEFYYVANLVSESSGYGRVMFCDNNNKYVVSETGRYITNSNAQFKDIYLQKVGGMTLAQYTRLTTSGNHGTWQSKCENNYGMRLNLGNITRILMNSEDFEPAGTRIRVWGQRAY